LFTASLERNETTMEGSNEPQQLMNTQYKRRTRAAKRGTDGQHCRLVTRQRQTDATMHSTDTTTYGLRYPLRTESGHDGADGSDDDDAQVRDQMSGGACEARILTVRSEPAALT